MRIKHGVALLFVPALLLFVSTACLAAPPGFLMAKAGVLEGTLVIKDGKPIPGGVIVSFFNTKDGPPPIYGNMHRVPDMVSRTDDEGKFSVKLLPGVYNMGAMIRARGEGAGPPRGEEEFFFITGDDGKLKSFTVPQKETVKIGTVKGVPIDAVPEIKNSVIVKGKVVDEIGNAVEGAYVLVKNDVNSARPLFISEKTDKNGDYSLTLPAGIPYYLLARQNMRGGRPLAGSLVGTYGKTAPAGAEGEYGIDAPVGVGGKGGQGEALTVMGNKGAILTDININMFQVPNPEENREKFEKKFRSDKPLEEK
jgi:hypothetical protein